FYLLRGHVQRRALIAGLAVIMHVAACVALVAVREGTESTPELGERAVWLAQHPAAWTMTWVIWSLASMSLLAFVVVWSARLLELKAAWATLKVASLLCGVGVLCDLSGETINIVGLTSPDLTLTEFE